MQFWGKHQLIFSKMYIEVLLLSIEGDIKQLTADFLRRHL